MQIISVRRSIKKLTLLGMAYLLSLCLSANAEPMFGEVYRDSEPTSESAAETFYGIEGIGPAIKSFSSTVAMKHTNTVSLWETEWTNPTPWLFFLQQGISPTKIDRVLERAENHNDFFSKLQLSDLYSNEQNKYLVYKWFLTQKLRRQNMRRDGIYQQNPVGIYTPTRPIEISPHVMTTWFVGLTGEDILLSSNTDSTPWLHTWEDAPTNPYGSLNREAMARYAQFLMEYYQADFFTPAREIDVSAGCWGFSNHPEDCGEEQLEPTDQFYKLYDALAIGIKRAQDNLRHSNPNKTLAIYPTWHTYFSAGCLGNLDPLVGIAIQKLNTINKLHGLKFDIGLSTYPLMCDDYADAKSVTQNQIRAFIRGVQIPPETYLSAPLSNGSVLHVTPSEAVVDGSTTDIVIGETAIDTWNSPGTDSFDGEDSREALRFDHYYHLATEFYRTVWYRRNQPNSPYEPAMTANGFHLSHVISSGYGAWNDAAFPIKFTDTQGREYFRWLRGGNSLALPLIYGGKPSPAALYLDSLISGDDYDGDGIPQIIVNPSGITQAKWYPYAQDSRDITLSVSWSTPDNCPYMYNPTQKDSDADGVGDACDNSVNISNSHQEDFDQDGIGNASDADFNNDGIINGLDKDMLEHCINTATENSFPSANCEAFPSGGFQSLPEVTDMTGDGKVTVADTNRFNDICNLSKHPNGCTPHYQKGRSKTAYYYCAGKRNFTENGEANVALSTKRFNNICPSPNTPALPNDSDGDGLLNNSSPEKHKKNFANPDINNDGIADGTITNTQVGGRWILALNEDISSSIDSDKDGIPDVAEAKFRDECSSNGLNYIARANQKMRDTDKDGLTDKIEYLIGTSPCSNDTDVDGLSDFTETKLSYTHLSPVGTIVTAKTNAQQNDSDYDGIWDGNEVHITATRPYDCDSDEDLFSDGYELSQNSNPLNINIFPDSKTGYWGCSWWRTGGNNL